MNEFCLEMKNYVVQEFPFFNKLLSMTDICTKLLFLDLRIADRLFLEIFKKQKGVLQHGIDVFQKHLFYKE